MEFRRKVYKYCRSLYILSFGNGCKSIFLKLSIYLLFFFIIFNLTNKIIMSEENLKNSVFTEKKLGKLYSNYYNLVISSTMLNYAERVKKDDAYYIIENGIKSKVYEYVGEINSKYNSSYSPDGNKLAYLIRTKIIGQTNQYKWNAVINKKIGKPYKFVKRVVFSPNSLHSAYIAVDQNKSFVVLDNVEGKKYDEVSSLMFNNKSKVSYVAKNNNTYFFVMQGKEYLGFEEINSLMANRNYESQLFSSDGNHFAYIGKTSNNFKLVIDGKMSSKNYEAIYWLNFFPNSKNLAFQTIENKKEVVVINEKKVSSQYDHIDFLTIGSSNTLSFRARLNNNWKIIQINEKKELIGKSYKYIGWDSNYRNNPFIKYSQSGKKIAYVALNKNNKKRIILNNIEDKKFFDNISNLSFNNKEQLAYVANIGCKWRKGWCRGGKSFVINNNKEIPGKYDQIGFLFFSPDSRHLTYWARLNNKTFIVVDGNEGRKFGGTIRNIKYSSDSRKLAYISIEDNIIWRRVIDISQL